eukprot:g2388.t1
MLRHHGTLLSTVNPLSPWRPVALNHFIGRVKCDPCVRIRPSESREFILRCSNLEASVESPLELDEIPIPSIPQSKEWELDFCSRPLLDERKKKVWELLICDPNNTFRYSQYFPNNKVNSTELKKCIEELLSKDGATPPKRVRYFRGQMRTIITRALDDLDIVVVPSRRCFVLRNWLKDRLKNVYPKDPRYTSTVQPLFTLDLGPPESLPDNLRGEAWDFVQLPLKVLMGELDDIKRGEIFGSGIDLKLVGLESLPMDTMIPGVSVYSRRAEPLAAWTSGLEIFRITADVDRSCLILETGVNERWRYGGYRLSEESVTQAKYWEKAKERSKGLHFLTIQDDPEAEYCYGLWLLLEAEPVE